MSGCKKTSSNFTLIELVVIMAVVMILAGIGAGAFRAALKKAERNRTVVTLNKIKVALEAFKNRYGFYPQYSFEPSSSPDYINYTAGANDFGFKLSDTFYDGSDFKLKSFLNLQSELNRGNATEGNGGYYMIDGWRNRIQYQCPGTTNEQAFDLYSKGEDSSDDSDDIWCEGLKSPGSSSTGSGNSGGGNSGGGNSGGGNSGGGNSGGGNGGGRR